MTFMKFMFKTLTRQARDIETVLDLFSKLTFKITHASITKTKKDVEPKMEIKRKHTHEDDSAFQKMIFLAKTITIETKPTTQGDAQKCSKISMGVSNIDID